VEDTTLVMCLMCGEEFVAPANVDSSKFDHYAVGLVTSVDSINKTGLKKVMVDVTGSGDSIQVLTNAKYVSVNWRVVVAKEEHYPLV